MNLWIKLPIYIRITYGPVEYILPTEYIYVYIYSVFFVPPTVSL